VANALGFQVEAHPPDWRRYGRGAGFVRNRQMVEEGKPDLVIAFHPALERSKGTLHTVTLAKKAGIRVLVVAG